VTSGVEGLDDILASASRRSSCTSSRATRARRRVARLVALTGYGQPEDRRRALEAGFTQHLVKPVELAQIRRVLETH
jgi:CheY-like chemotaxis protein